MLRYSTSIRLLAASISLGGCSFSMSADVAAGGGIALQKDLAEADETGFRPEMAETKKAARVGSTSVGIGLHGHLVNMPIGSGLRLEGRQTDQVGDESTVDKSWRDTSIWYDGLLGASAGGRAWYLRGSLDIQDTTANNERGYQFGVGSIFAVTKALKWDYRPIPAFLGRGRFVELFYSYERDLLTAPDERQYMRRSHVYGLRFGVYWDYGMCFYYFLCFE